MEKKTYKRPQSREHVFAHRTADVGGEYDPGKPIDGKGSDFFDENEDELIKQQGYEPTWGY